MSSLKRLSRDVRIRELVQKHMTALSHEIAQELTQPLLEHWGLLSETLDEHAPALPVTAMQPLKALLYDNATKLWTCPQCGRFTDPRRRSVTAHLRFCDAPVAVLALKNASRRTRRTKTKKKP
jgi:hypothetical protein